MGQSKPVKSIFSNAKLWDMLVVVKDIDKTVKRLAELGVAPFIEGTPPEGAEGLYYQGKPLVSSSKALLGRIGDMEIELNQPEDKPNNPWSEYARTKGEGIHHLGFQVDDVEEGVKQLVSHGAEVMCEGKINGKIGSAYVDLKVGNIVFELTSFNNVEKK
jgi:methylmalonyl-CoA/ethylmalonyl-CoA epimerase